MNDLSETAGLVSIRQDLIDELKQGICTVSFTKVDGTERTIRGTLRTECLPEDYDETNAKTNEDVVPLYDVDADHWKSFRIDSANQFESNDKVFVWAEDISKVSIDAAKPGKDLITLVHPVKDE